MEEKYNKWGKKKHCGGFCGLEWSGYILAHHVSGMVPYSSDKKNFLIFFISFEKKPCCACLGHRQKLLIILVLIQSLSVPASNSCLY
jgi:ligand-binding sensor domain-containing protein